MIHLMFLILLLCVLILQGLASDVPPTENLLKLKKLKIEQTKCKVQMTKAAVPKIASPTKKVRSWMDEGACKMPAGDVSQSHVSPQTINMAVLMVVWDDIDKSTILDPEGYADYWGNTGNIREWFSAASDGCIHLRVTVFFMTTTLTEKDDFGNCRLSSTDDLDNFNFVLDEGNDWNQLQDEGYWHHTVFMPLQKQCPTPALAGGHSTSVNGVYSGDGYAGIFMGHWAGSHLTMQKNIFGEDSGFYGSQTTFIHEMIHILGAGYHSSMDVCDRSQMTCGWEEYGDWYDALGTGNSNYARNLNAKIRYDMGWLDGSNITTIRSRGSYTIKPLNDMTSLDLPRAAVVLVGGNRIWIEHRSGNDLSAEPPTAFGSDYNPGLFIREWSTLIDADVRDCAGEFGWDGALDDERSQVTLTPGKVQTFGADLRIGGVTYNDDGSITFDVHVTGSKVDCWYGFPTLNQFIWIGDQDALDSYYMGSVKEYAQGFQQDFGFYDKLGAMDRQSYSYMKGHDAGGSQDCAIGKLEFKLKYSQGLNGAGDVKPGIEALPGWAWGARTNVSTESGWDTSSTIGFGFPADTPDGDYDFCFVSVDMRSGLQASTLFRLSIGSMDMWYNSREEYFIDEVSEEMRTACANEHHVCHPNFPNCMSLMPQVFCDVDLECPITEGEYSAWGRCVEDPSPSYDDTNIIGQRTRGYDMCDMNTAAYRNQKFCTMPPGVAMAETEPCDDPFIKMCPDQNSCRIDPGWHLVKPSNAQSLDYEDFQHGPGYCYTGSLGKYGAGWYEFNELCDEVADRVSFCDPTLTGLGAARKAYDRTHMCDFDFEERVACMAKVCQDEPLCAGMSVNEGSFWPDAVVLHSFPNVNDPLSAINDIFIRPMDLEEEADYGSPKDLKERAICIAAPIKAGKEFPTCACLGGAPEVPYTSKTCNMASFPDSIDPDEELAERFKVGYEYTPSDDDGGFWDNWVESVIGVGDDDGDDTPAVDDNAAADDYTSADDLFDDAMDDSERAYEVLGWKYNNHNWTEITARYCPWTYGIGASRIYRSYIDLDEWENKFKVRMMFSFTRLRGGLGASGSSTTVTLATSRRGASTTVPLLNARDFTMDMFESDEPYYMSSSVYNADRRSRLTVVVVEASFPPKTNTESVFRKLKSIKVTIGDVEDNNICIQTSVQKMGAAP